MDAKLFKFFTQVELIANIALAISRGVLAAMNSSNIQSPDVQSNARENQERQAQAKDKLSVRSNIDK